MDKKKITLHSFLHSLGVVIYIALVSLLMTNSEKIFGEMADFWGPLAMLLLFTVSAAVTGLLVFGRPVYLFLQGMKKEAIQFTFYTLGFLIAESLVVFIILFAVR
ncbi:hypothetical protein KKF61_05535 [Patescibacteria group bacterium]|nr:hypothetical protein [Patescibacteria group bacterium]MBU0963529.1 hypothetical protein [Patescibacteria group bacterium]